MKVISGVLSVVVLMTSTSSFANVPVAEVAPSREEYAAEVYAHLASLSNLDQVDQAIAKSGLSKAEILGAALRSGKTTPKQINKAQMLAMDPASAYCVGAAVFLGACVLMNLLRR